MAELFLQTKLFVPPLRPFVISRPHLVQKLNTGLNTKFTLVSAPPGFGKTTLICSWLQQCSRPFTWLSLDKEDNEPSRLFMYLIGALQKIDKGAGQTAASLLQSSQPPPLETLMTLVINDLAETTQPAILVLDDYHIIQNLEIHHALEFFLDNLPPRLHLVIASREDPPLPLHRLRSSGQMQGIYAHDLRFSPDEAAEFLQQTMKLDIAAEDVSALAKRTEGWIAGLQLAALSMQGMPDAHAFVTGFTGDDRYIADYLLHEVLERQPEHIREFLWLTAVFDRFCASLCDAILETPANHSKAIISYLDEINLFTIPLDNRREWYRYHHLFSDFLCLHARHEFAERVTLAHQRAAAWYESKGFLFEAIENALAGEDYQRAGRLIEKNGMAAIFGHAQWATLLGWMKALPPEIFQAWPQLDLHFAWALFSTGNWLETESYLKRVESSFAEANEAANQQWMLGEAATIRALVFYETGELERSKEMASRAYGLLPETNKTIRSVALLAEGMAQMWSDNNSRAKHIFLSRAFEMAQAAGNVTVSLFALGCRAMLDVRAGRLQQAAKLYQQTKLLGTVEGELLLGPAGFACVQMGEVLHEWNRVEESEKVLWKGIKLCEQQGGMPVWIIEGHVNLARLMLASGKEQEAERLMRLAEALLMELPKHGKTVGHLIAATQVYRLRYWLAREKGDTARQWLAEHGISTGTVISRDNVTYHLLLARILIEQGGLGEAHRLLRRVDEKAADYESLRLSAELLILHALWLNAQGARDEALQMLSRSLRLTEPEGYIRLFIDYGEPMAELLQTVFQQGFMPSYIKQLLFAFDHSPSHTPVDLTDLPIESLNDREQQTLKLMAAGLSNREIAEALYLSVNTIKVYTSRIYSKLGVHGRTEAVNCAHKLGIL